MCDLQVKPAVEPLDSRGLGTERASAMTKHRIYEMPFADVYPHYVAKAEKKGRTKAEVDKVIRWLTGYTQRQLNSQL